MSVTGDLDFPILGRQLRARALPSLTAAWLWRGWRFPEHDEPLHPFAIHLQATDRAPDLLPGPERAVRVRPGVAIGWRVRGSHWETGGLLRGLRASFEAHGTQISLWGSDRPDESEAIHHALNAILCESLRRSGLVPLHGSVVTAKGGTTGIVGPRGVGKTFAMLQAVAEGAHPVADDLSWLDPATLVVHGWDRGIRMEAAAMPQAQPRLPPGAGRWELDRDGKLLLPYARLGIPRVERSVLSSVAILRRRGERLTRDPLAGLQALKALRAATGVPLTPEARSAVLAYLPSLLSRITAFSLPFAEANEAPRPLAVADAG